MDRQGDASSRVIAHLRRKRLLQVHLGVAAIIVALASAIWFLERDDSRTADSFAGFWPAWIMLIWAVPLAVHGLYVFAKKDLKRDQPFPPPRTRYSRAGRSLMTVLFTDIVGSTEHAVREGDRRWREMLDGHDEAAKAIVAYGGGRLVKSTGDGILALFDSPNRAIVVANRFCGELRAIGLDVRVGLHAGEVEFRGSDVGGIAVHVAARVMAAGVPGEITVSRTLRDLVAGSEITFQDRGTHELKGVGEWQLFAAMPSGSATR